MRLLRFALPLVVLLAAIPAAYAQTDPRRDPKAIGILQQSFMAMGGRVPASVAATGTVLINKSSGAETGTVRVSIRGLDQNSEELQVGGETVRVVQSRGRSSDGNKLHSLERAVNSQALSFPLQILARILTDSSFGVEYVELDASTGNPAHHLRVWQTFPGKPKLQPLEDVSRKDIWIDAASNLPIRLAFDQRNSRGPGSVAFHVELAYSAFRGEGGVLFPAKIEKRMNGTVWGTFEITSIVLNPGLTDSDFRLR